MTAPALGWCPHDEDPLCCPLCQPQDDPWADNPPARPLLGTRIWRGPPRPCVIGCDDQILVGDPVTVLLPDRTSQVPDSTPAAHTACRAPTGAPA